MVVDDTRLVTISLSTPQYPAASIIALDAPESAPAGSTLAIAVTVRNVGDVSGILWIQILDMDTGNILSSVNTSILAVGEESSFQFTNIKMPSDRDLRLEIEAGHYEEKGGPL